MHIGILSGQPVAYLANETHTTANYIHMVISVAMLPLLSLTRFTVAMSSLAHTALQIMLQTLKSTITL